MADEKPKGWGDPRVHIDRTAAAVGTRCATDYCDVTAGVLDG